jgi:corrinoid protein of di/trimethylamine methyltransferase
MSEEALESLKKAVMEYDSQGAANWAEKAIGENIEPLVILDALTVSIREVGDLFGKGELWLPDLVGAASAMQAAMPIIEKKLKDTGVKRQSLGVVVIGTVFGDIHNIGKDMVCTLLTAGGFEVHDLGVNVPAEKFITAINEHGANILAMSALLTTTAPEQRKVIDQLNSSGVRKNIKIIVGGGAITSSFADDIGADGYEPTAPGAVALARRLVGK